eukprot:11683166-Prorocentrum_lima.AAC.1
MTRHLRKQKGFELGCWVVPTRVWRGVNPQATMYEDIRSIPFVIREGSGARLLVHTRAAFAVVAPDPAGRFRKPQ